VRKKAKKLSKCQEEVELVKELAKIKSYNKVIMKKDKVEPTQVEHPIKLSPLRKTS
jgi:hypothetical protein